MMLVGWGFAKIEIPLRELWTDFFGSVENRALKSYEEKQMKSQKDSLTQKALAWQHLQDSLALVEKMKRDSLALVEKTKRDSLAQVERMEAFFCLNREIEKSEEDPCQSTLYYYRGILGKGTNWLIGSTKCPNIAMIPAGLYGNFPLALLDSRWVKRRFAYRSSVRAREVFRALGICK